MQLFIDDGYTTRVGYKEASGRAAVEFTMRPYAGAEGHREYMKSRLADDATDIVIGQMLGDEKNPARISDLSFPGRLDKVELSREKLRTLRSPEFTLLMLSMYDQVVPDYEVRTIDGETKQVPFALSAEREKN